jgi:hypothetical protein
MRLAPAVLFLSLLAACADPYPHADPATMDKAAPYPDLVPAETIRARVPEARTTPETQADLDARAERLRERAAALRRPAMDGETRTRMQAGVGG